MKPFAINLALDWVIKLLGRVCASSFEGAIKRGGFFYQTHPFISYRNDQMLFHRSFVNGVEYELISSPRLTSKLRSESK